MRFLFSLTLFCSLAACSGASPDSCSDDTDCPLGRYCQLGACVFDCALDTECPEGYVCSPNGRCEHGCKPTNGGQEACDGLDNDCDGDVDEDFADLGTPCANGGCPAGLWVCSAGGDGLVCDGPSPADDDATCDGVDEDCDGQTDEDVAPLACELHVGVCEGAVRECVQGAFAECDYGPVYTPDTDDTCDLLDNDCDGQTDEDGQLQYIAEDGEMASDGIDNNCNGLVDEAGGVMVPLLHGEPRWIDAYEATVFANADCTGLRYGQAADDYPVEWPAEGDASVTLYACSLKDSIPSGFVSWHRARRACEAQGKRLCSVNEFGSACNAGTGDDFPWGQMPVPGACNDALTGSGQKEPTGFREGCTAGNGTFDMVGNQAEWLLEWSENYPGRALLGGWSCVCEFLRPNGDLDVCDPGDPDQVAKMESMNDCDVTRVSSEEAYPFASHPAHFGFRCCIGGD